MLARHAESLFWAGRYIERAADTARMIDVTYHGLLESTPLEAEQAWLDLLSVLRLDAAFAARQHGVSAVSVSEFVVIDDDNPGSIVSTVTQARENLRSVREMVTTDVWESINTFHLELRLRDLRADLEQQPYELYRLVKERCQMVAGVAAETMARDDGWRFLQLGWMLERAEMTCRLLDVRYGDGRTRDFHHWMGTLKSASALEAYRKAHRSSMDTCDVIDFLLMSRTFPRSVLFCLRRAETDLGLLGRGDQRLSRPERILGRIRSDLEFRDVTEVIEAGLRRYLGDLQVGVRTVASAIGEEYFRSSDMTINPLEPHLAGNCAQLRLDIRYQTRFIYDSPARESQNELRACPTSDDAQSLISYRVTTTPSARVLSFVDDWGTRVDAFGVRELHTQLDVVAEASVETRQRPLLTTSPRLDALHDPIFVDDHIEYLQPSPHAGWGDGVVEAAARATEYCTPDVISQVLALHRFVGMTLSYAPGTTFVGVHVEKVLASETGVCQDFAHLAVALCRARNIPARYVSGYFFATDDATGEDGADDVVRVQTHAWFEAAIPDFGWLPLDPTNRQEVGLRHVKIGHGRDYDDVVPLRGVFSGAAAHHVDVDVEIRRPAATAGTTRAPKPRPHAHGAPPTIAPGRPRATIDSDGTDLEQLTQQQQQQQ